VIDFYKNRVILFCVSIKLRTAIESVLAMGYFKNENARSSKAVYGHEDAIAEKIKLAGFAEELKEKYPKISKSMLKEWASFGDDTKLRAATVNMPAGTYILQPAGSQGFPDILVKDFSDRFVAIECKSSKLMTPMWNDNLPKPNAIYIFASKSLNKTTLFLGKDVINEDTVKLQSQLMQEMEMVVKKYAIKSKDVDNYKRGWHLRFRPQNFQQGGSEMTNYFTHASRESCENNVLTFSSQ
jgi:hypothetical protein